MWREEESIMGESVKGGECKGRRVNAKCNLGGGSVRKENVRGRNTQCMEEETV